MVRFLVQMFPFFCSSVSVLPFKCSGIPVQILPKYADIISSLQKTLGEIYKNEGTFGLLNSASQFYLDGNKGVFKYALKMLKGKTVPKTEIAEIIPLLINIMLIEPKHGKYILWFLRTNSNNINKIELSDLLNKEITKVLKNNYQQELGQFIQIIIDLNLDITEENIIGILKGEDDLSKIMALDIYKNRINAITKRNIKGNEIDMEIQTLGNALKPEKYNSEHWLLVYEVQMHNLIPSSYFTQYPPDSFFSELKKNEVSFTGD